jgi:RND family efflux transporter MFP subunit
VKVETIQVTRGDLITVVYATGSVIADSLTTLRAQVAGNVLYAGPKEGVKVARNTLLLRIDQSDLLLQIQQSEKDIETAKIDLQDKKLNLDRMKNLVANKSVTQKEYDDAKRDYDMGKVALERSSIMLNKQKENLAKSEIKAPYDCVIIGAKVNTGDYLAINTDCFRIISPNSLLVEAEVDEQDVAKLSIGQQCIVAFDAFAEKKFNGKIFRMVPETDKTTKTSHVCIKLDTIPKSLNVGMTATVNVVGEKKCNILILPKSGIITKDGKSYVYTIENGCLKENEIKIGLSEGKYAEVLAGVKEGEFIVNEPKPEFKPGLRVSTK